jgi:hypothetical protein
LMIFWKFPHQTPGQGPWRWLIETVSGPIARSVLLLTQSA